MDIPWTLPLFRYLLVIMLMQCLLHAIDCLLVNRILYDSKFSIQFYDFLYKPLYNCLACSGSILNPNTCFPYCRISPTLLSPRPLSLATCQIIVIPSSQNILVTRNRKSGNWESGFRYPEITFLCLITVSISMGIFVKSLPHLRCVAAFTNVPVEITIQYAQK